MDSKKQMEGNFHKVCKMEYSVLQDGVNIDVMLNASTLHQYSNLEGNNDNNYLLMNGKI